VELTNKYPVLKIRLEPKVYSNNEIHENKKVIVECIKCLSKFIYENINMKKVYQTIYITGKSNCYIK